MVEYSHRPFDMGISEQIMKKHKNQYLVALFASQSVKTGPYRDGYNSLLFLHEIKPIIIHKP